MQKIAEEKTLSMKYFGISFVAKRILLFFNYHLFGTTIRGASLDKLKCYPEQQQKQQQDLKNLKSFGVVHK